MMCYSNCIYVIILLPVLLLSNFNIISLSLCTLDLAICKELNAYIEKDTKYRNNYKVISDYLPLRRV